MTSTTPIVPLSVTVIDSWNFALSDAILAMGIPSVDDNESSNSSDDEQLLVFHDDDESSSDNDNDDGDTNTLSSSSGPPILSVLSEEWALTNPEREGLLVFLRNSRHACKRIDSYYAKHSVHQSVSDTEAWLPTIAAKSFINRGPLEGRHVTIRAVTSAFARHSGIVVASSDGATGSVSTGGTLVPFPIESSSSSESPK
jgi:hypothetical protein